MRVGTTLLITTLLMLAACKDQHSIGVFAGRGELLASGKTLDDTWRIYCGVDQSAGGRYSFGPAPANACATGGNPHPCVQAEFRGSTLTRCQLEDLSKKKLISNSFPVGDDEWLLFGVLDPDVASLSFELTNGANLPVRIVSPPNGAFKLFAIGLGKTLATRLERPILKDSAGNTVSPRDTA